MRHTWTSFALALFGLIVLVLLQESNATQTIIERVARSFASSRLPKDILEELTPDQIASLAKMHHENEQVLQYTPDLSLESKYDDVEFQDKVGSLLSTSDVEKKAEVIAGLRKDDLVTAGIKSKSSSKSNGYDRVYKNFRFAERRNSQEHRSSPTATVVTADAPSQPVKPYVAPLPPMPQMLEDCMACRLVWKQVEMDVSNARYPEDVRASFEHNCMEAQKSNIFYKACEDMSDDAYALIDDYMSQKYTVEQMCLRGNLCRDKSLYNQTKASF